MCAIRVSTHLALTVPTCSFHLVVSFRCLRNFVYLKYIQKHIYSYRVLIFDIGYILYELSYKATNTRRYLYEFVRVVIQSIQDTPGAYIRYTLVTLYNISILTIYLKIEVTSPTAVPADINSRMSRAPLLIPS